MQKMFSSNYNNVINPFAHLLPSSYLPPPPPMVSFDHQDSNDVHLHHYDLISATSLLPSNNPLLTESLINMALCNNTAAADGGGLQMEFFSGGNSSVPVKKPVKKDRHSKIQTAKGVRDRRVRLSIEIAREFFDLQDMLGFDKPSKTLEWLLTKSRKAIKELVNMKHGGPRSLFDEDGDVDSSELEGTTPRSNSPDQDSVSKEIKMKRLHKAKVHLLAKESRAKARERARERTREKMCTATASPQFLNQLTLTQVEASNKPDQSYVHNMASSSCFKVVATQQVEDPGCQNGFRESIMIKRRLKQSIVLGSDQQNIAVLKDGNNYFPNLSENWDANGAMPHSTFCAMTNVNFSTGDELYEKP